MSLVCIQIGFFGGLDDFLPGTYVFAYTDLFWRMLSLGVEAKVVGHIPQLAPELVRWQWRVFVKHVVGNLLHEPVERLAFQPLFDGELIADVAHVDVAGERLSGVEVLLVLRVEPGLDDPSVAEERMMDLLTILATG